MSSLFLPEGVTASHLLFLLQLQAKHQICSCTSARSVSIISFLRRTFFENILSRLLALQSIVVAVLNAFAMFWYFLPLAQLPTNWDASIGNISALILLVGLWSTSHCTALVTFCQASRYIGGSFWFICKTNFFIFHFLAQWALAELFRVFYYVYAKGEVSFSYICQSTNSYRYLI